MIPGKERGGSNSTVVLYLCGGVGECCKGMRVLRKNNISRGINFRSEMSSRSSSTVFDWDNSCKCDGRRKSNSYENSDLPCWLFPLLG